MPKVLSSSYCHLSTPCGEINYTLERKYVRNINFRIKQGGELYISASPAVSKKYIEGLLSRDAGQLIRKIESAKKVSEEKRAENEDISKVCFLGKKYPLVIKNTPGERTSCVFEEGIFVINSEKDLNKEEISGMIKTWKQLKAREIYTVINKEVWEDFKAHHKGTGDSVALQVKQHFQAASKWDRMALNAPTQGSGSVILKIAMTNFFNWIVEKGYFGKVEISASIHDKKFVVSKPR
jgi:hypothetical protein